MSLLVSQYLSPCSMMWQTLSGLSLLSLASVSVSATKGFRYDQGPAQANDQIPSIVPGKFIVEFQDGAGDNFHGGSVS